MKTNHRNTLLIQIALSAEPLRASQSQLRNDAIAQVLVRPRVARHAFHAHHVLLAGRRSSGRRGHVRDLHLEANRALLAEQHGRRRAGAQPAVRRPERVELALDAIHVDHALDLGHDVGDGLGRRVRHVEGGAQTARGRVEARGGGG